jgi:hypothetical protein
MNKEEKIKFANDELIGHGSLNVVDEIFSTEYILHTGDKDYKGREFIKRWVKQLRSAIPDIKVLKVEFLNEEDRTITWQRTLSGTHKASMQGIPPVRKT